MSVPLNFEILKEIESILKSLDYFGVGMVEMKVDYFIEFNPRFWGSLSLAIECGLNFPLYLIKAYIGEKIDKNYNYKKGGYWVMKIKPLLAEKVFFFISNFIIFKKKTLNTLRVIIYHFIPKEYWIYFLRVISRMICVFY
ncbi:MAG: hypothetical protein ABIL76_00560 [candidate division WOR-3 bacterium]